MMFSGIKSYKSSIRKQLKKKDQSLHSIIAHSLKDKGIVEVLVGIYSELYLLKKQLMAKGVIEPEQAYLVGEVYEFLAEQDKKK